MVDLSIIIVNWNVRDLLRRCLTSLAAARTGFTSEVFVVDNASADGSADMVRGEFPDVILIENTHNAGFTRANNQAIARSSGRYVLLLNPDTEVAPDALTILLSFMEAHPQVGVAGPQLVYADGNIQSSRRRFPTLGTLFLESTVLQRLLPKSALLRRYYLLDRPHDVIQDVDWLVGACLMVRRQAIDDAGLLDERFFMYCEEVDWCYRIKQHGWTVIYLPTARVMHHEARSSGQVVAAQHIYFFASRVAYAEKYFGHVRAEILRLYLLAMYVYLMIEEGLKWLFGSKRALHAGFLAAYATVLASRLRI